MAYINKLWYVKQTHREKSIVEQVSKNAWISIEMIEQNKYLYHVC